MKDRLAIGRVRSAFGLKGEIKVESFSGEVEHFASLLAIDLCWGQRTRHFAVESVRIAHRTVLMKLVGIDTPEAAAALRGGEIVVDRSQAARLANGEYYYADLDDLAVLYDGRIVGRVAAIWESGAGPLLEVSGGEGRGVLVPFLDAFFGQVDIENGIIELVDGTVLE